MPSRIRVQASQSAPRHEGSQESTQISQEWTPMPITAAAAATQQLLPSAQWFQQKLPRAGQRMAAYLALSFLSAFAVLLLSSSAGSGVPPMKVADGKYQAVEPLSCTDSFWLPDGGCGIEGEKCQPFDNQVLAFRCPAHCIAAANRKKKAPPHYVGPETITDGRPLVIGGGPYYRADSHICAAAVYSGLFDDATGGCAIATTSGMTSMFPVGSPLYGIQTIPFRTYFPMAFRFRYESGAACGQNQSNSSDRSPWVAAVVPSLLTAAYTAQVFLFASSTTIPVLSSAAAGFLFTRMAMGGPDVSVLPVHLRAAAKSGHFLPAVSAFVVALACTAFMIRLSARRSPQRPAATYDLVGLWLGAFWLGLLSLQLFPWVSPTPLSTPLYYWVAVLFILLPEAKLRDHVRLGLQAFLLGLFVYSMASTGLALPFSAHSTSPYTPTAGSSHATFVPTPRYPEILAPKIDVGFGGSNGTFSWRTPVPDGVNGISMLVNDVERERKSFASGAGKNGQYGSFEMQRTPQAVPDYLRFSWLRDGQVLGWSGVGTWEVDGAWSGIDRA